MSTKSYPTRIINITRGQDKILKRSHRIFNLLLCQIIQVYLDMRKCKYGIVGKEIVEYLLQSNCHAHDLMNPLTAREAKDALENEGMKLVKKFRAERGILFSRYEKLGQIDDKIVCAAGRVKNKDDLLDTEKLIVDPKYWQMICNESMRCLRSFYKLLDGWRKDRQCWYEAREKFQKENPEFMKIWRGDFEVFEKLFEEERVRNQTNARQKVTSRRRIKSGLGNRYFRWQRWYEWLTKNQALIEWRGKAERSEFAVLTNEEIKEIKSKYPKRQDRATSENLKILFEKNPELKELEKLRQQYVNEFRKFKRPATLTLPSPVKHSRWLLLEKGEQYRNVDFDKGTVELKLILKDDRGGYYQGWQSFDIAVDDRLKPEYRKLNFQREMKLPPYTEDKKFLKKAKEAKDRKAKLKGSKLVLGSNAVHLIFTVEEQDAPLKVKCQKVAKRRCSADNIFGLDGERRAIRVIAIDLGARHVGAYAIADGKFKLNGKLWEINWLKKGFISSCDIPELKDIFQHERELKQLRRKRGKPVRDEKSFTELQIHRTNMSDDRFKKASSAIIQLARSYDVDVVVLENLKGLTQSYSRERWLNKQIKGMNHRNIFNMVSQQCEEFGMLFRDEKAYLTSRLCCKCGLGGVRFSFKKKDLFKEKKPKVQCEDFGYPVWDTGGHLFYCPHCNYKINADINAASNLVRVFFGQFNSFNMRPKDHVYKWKEGDIDKVFDSQEAFKKWADGVQSRKLAEKSPF